jgi:hypothetical protein
LADREIIRPAEPDDIPLLSTLFHEAFGDERHPAVWAWKYFGERSSVSYVCEAEGRIVAHCGGIPVQFRDGRAQYTAYQSVDFMSSPSYVGGAGGGGVFVRTVRRMFEECCGPTRTPLVYGFPGERHRMVGERLLGYTALEPVHEFRLETAGPSTRTQPLDAKFLGLFRRPRHQFGAIRDEAYLRWRYLFHPFHHYEVVSVTTGPLRQRTAALLRSLEDRLVLMELGGSLSERGTAALIRALQRSGKPVEGWLSARHPISLLLQTHGVRTTPRDHWLEYRFFHERAAPHAGDFYYTMGDYDVH